MSDLGNLDIDLNDVKPPILDSGEQKQQPVEEKAVEAEANNTEQESPRDIGEIPKDFDSLVSEMDGAENTEQETQETQEVQDNSQQETKKGKSKEENLAAMRRSLKSKEEEIETLKKDLEEKGGNQLTLEEANSKMQELEQKLQDVQKERDEYSNYKAAFDITKTDSYKKEILEPRKAQENLLIETAEQYGLTKEQLKQGLDSSNLAELERTLSGYGMTSTGIMAVVNSVKTLQGITNKERALMQDSKGWLESLQKQDAESRQALMNQIGETIQKNSSIIWDSTLSAFREDAVKGRFPYAQKGSDSNWNKAIDSADQVGQKVYVEFLKDLESNVKNNTVTPSLIDKASKLSFSYGHFLLSQQSQMALAKQNQELKNRIAILEGDSPGLGGSSGYRASNNGSKTTYSKSLEDLADEFK